MKVLISAIACDPFGWSESFVGWQAVNAIAKDHSVWVLTSPRYRESFEKAQAEGSLPGSVQVHYHGVSPTWNANRLIARLQSWNEFLQWNRQLVPAAEALHNRFRFDLAHHVTYSTWRVPSPLWKLPIPLVWGPVGGAGSMPFRFSSNMGISGQVFEAARAAGKLARYSGPLRECAQRAAHILASSRETVEVMQRMRGTQSGISLLSPGFFSDLQLEAFSQATAPRRWDGVLRIFAGGSIIGSKGYPLALRALKAFKDKGGRFKYTIAGGGPEMQHVKQVAANLGLNEVNFTDSLHGASYTSALKDAHIFLLPSFRENIGLTMMEAMLAGCVPVVLDTSAPGEIVSAECGIKVRVGSTSQVVEDLERAVTLLSENPRVVESLSKAATLRIQEKYNEGHYRRSISKVYDSVLRGA